MTISTEVQSCINALDNTCSGQSILLSAIGATETTNRSVSVPSAEDLPDLTENSISNGTIVYVVDQDNYFVVNDISWIGLDDKALRVDSRRDLYSWGYNLCGQLGDGTRTSRCVPTQESTAATDWCAVSAGLYYTTAIKTTGELYSWGANFSGGLGDGTTVAKCVPTQESTAATDWCAVAAGNSHTAAIKTTGALYAWGSNGGGNIGDGTTVAKCVPTQECTAATNWCAVSAGNGQTVAIKTTGALYAWGCNNVGQIGDGTVVGKCVPTQESTSATDWCAVASGSATVVAIKTTGELYAWGSNFCGKLGDGTVVCRCVPTRESTSATNWCSASTLGHTAAIKTTGELYAWGQNGNGQLGDRTITNRCVPTQEYTAATNWCVVSAGSCHTAAIKTTGALYAWGRNLCGALGDGTTAYRCVPTQEYTCATNWFAVAAGESQTISHTAAIQFVT